MPANGRWDLTWRLKGQNLLHFYFGRWEVGVKYKRRHGFHTERSFYYSPSLLSQRNPV